MFNRRVASSCGIPQSMWRSLHIMSRRQANNVLPPMVPLTSSTAMTPATTAVAIGLGSMISTMSTEAFASLTSLGLSQQSLLQLISLNPLFIQLLADTMCCSYIVHAEHEQERFSIVRNRL